MGGAVLLLTSLVSLLGGLLFGYELAVISGALPQLRALFRLSCVHQEVLVSALPAGALLASLGGGLLIDRHGRRHSVLLSAALVAAGSLVPLAGSYWALLVGRAAGGLGVCWSSMSCCILVSEAVAPRRRGLMVALYEVGITAGILAAYAANYFLSAAGGGWRAMFALAALPAVAQMVAVWSLPAPVAPGDSEPPEDQLMGPMAEDETQEGSESPATTLQCSQGPYSILYLLRSRDNMRRRTTIGLGLVISQQLTGQPNVLFYAATVFRSLGLQSDASALLASVGLGAVKVLATVVAMALADRAGRRPLLIGGCAVMAMCLLAIGLMGGGSPPSGGPCGFEDLAANASFPSNGSRGNITTADGSRGLVADIAQQRADEAFGSAGLPTPASHTTTGHSWVILAFMMGVVSAYSVGFGPMTWVILSEIFPAAYRGRAFAFTNCFNWAANLLVTFSFLNVIDVIGLSGTFVLYGLMAAAAVVFFYCVLPETKGKSLEQVDRELRANRVHNGEECCGFIRRRTASRKYQPLQCQHGTPD